MNQPRPFLPCLLQVLVPLMGRGQGELDQEMEMQVMPIMHSLSSCAPKRQEKVGAPRAMLSYHGLVLCESSGALGVLVLRNGHD
jgi:hypothetical protein